MESLGKFKCWVYRIVLVICVKKTLQEPNMGIFNKETDDERWVVLVNVRKHLQEKTGFTLQYTGFPAFQTFQNKS